MSTSTLDLRKHPFVLVSLILLLRTGRLRSLKHPKHGLAIIVNETARLRRILLANSLQRFWIRRTGKAQKAQNKSDKEQMIWAKRARYKMRLAPIHFTPESRPHGAVAARIESAQVTPRELQSLIDCGYPVSGFLAVMGLQSPRDRRSTVHYSGHDRLEWESPEGDNDPTTQYRYHSFIHPERCYLPSGTQRGLGAPVRQTTQDQSRMSEKQFTQHIQGTRHDLSMTSALREVCVLGFRPKDAAQKYGVSLGRLKKAAHRLRRRADGSYVKPVFSGEVSLVCA